MFARNECMIVYSRRRARRGGWPSAVSHRRHSNTSVCNNVLLFLSAVKRDAGNVRLFDIDDLQASHIYRVGGGDAVCCSESKLQILRYIFYLF